MQKLWKSGAIPLLPLYVTVAWTRKIYLYSHICDGLIVKNIPPTATSNFFCLKCVGSLIRIFWVIVVVSVHHQQCDNSTEYDKKRFSRTELSFMCSASLTFPLGLPPRCVQHCSEGDRAVASTCLLVTVVSVDGACPVRRRHHHQRHWVNGGCVSLEHRNILYNSYAQVHTFPITMAQVELLRNTPPPLQSQCQFPTYHCCCPHSLQISYLMSATWFSL
jgi:hypothetical protein